MEKYNDMDLWRSFSQSQMRERFRIAGFQNENYTGVDLDYYRNCNIIEQNELDDAWCEGYDERQEIDKG